MTKLNRVQNLDYRRNLVILKNRAPLEASLGWSLGNRVGLAKHSEFCFSLFVLSRVRTNSVTSVRHRDGLEYIRI